jgi:Rieske Fe-S protein
MSDGTGATRRMLVLGAGVGALGAAGLLAGCGDSGNESKGTTPTVTPTSAAGGVVLVKTGDVPVGGGTIVAAQGVVVTQPTAGTFKGFSATCTHQQCQVRTVADGKISCPCHGSAFSIVDGSVVNGPATAPLPAKAIAVSGGEVRLG